MWVYPGLSENVIGIFRFRLLLRNKSGIYYLYYCRASSPDCVRVGLVGWWCHGLGLLFCQTGRYNHVVKLCLTIQQECLEYIGA